MNRFQRELISRLAALVVGAAVLYGGYRCIAKGIEFNEEAQRRHDQLGVEYRNTRKTSGAGLPFLAGGVLLIIGLPIALFAITPPALLERIFHPSAPRTGESRPDIQPASRWWNVFDWW